MASTELRLLAKVLDEGDLKPLLEKKLSTDHFKTFGGKAIYRRILSYYNSRITNGEVPERSLIEKEFPKEDLPRKERTSLAGVLEEFMNEYVQGELYDLGEFMIENQDRPDLVLQVIGETHQRLAKHRRTSEDYELSASVDQVRQTYESYRDNQGYLGVPYPWEVLNYETGGMLNGEFVILYGRPKSMKTWVLLASACHAYEKAGRRVLICTREMTPQQIMNRCVCILIGCPYSAFKHGSMKDILVYEGGTMEERFYDYLSTMKQDEEVCKLESGHGKSLIITSDRADPEGGGVQGLRQKVDDWGPDVLYVDAMYLMKDDRENRRSVKWYNQTAISQDLKDLALDFNIPVVGTNQAKRDSEEKAGKAVSNIAFSDSFGMDCDIAIELIKKSTRDKEVNEIAMAITASREINMTGFAIHGNAATDFSCLMTKLRDENGVVVGPKGEPILTPVVFQEYGDLKEFFKDAKEPENTSRAAQAKLAREAWESANASKPKPRTRRKP